MFRKILVLCLISFLGLSWGVVTADGDEPATVFYVKAGATGDNSGTSWANAFRDIQDALIAASSAGGGQIWVAQGTYIPSTDSSRSATFQLVNGVSLYGGFSGTETSLCQRNWNVYPTILSGDLSGNDVPGSDTSKNDNVYHVVTGSGTNTTAVLDGFIITAGNANGSASNNGGGGIYNYSGSPAISNCTFNDNRALYGGGMYNHAGNPAISNCMLNNNMATYYGGGTYSESGSAPAFVNCTFSTNNGLSRGAAAYNNSSNATFTGCIFSENYGSAAMYNTGTSEPQITDCAFANNASTAIYFSNSSVRSPQITSCVFAGNHNTSDNGGAICCYSNCNAVVTNCVFSGNSADDYGGAIYVSSSSHPVAKNCIIWGNTASYSGSEIHVAGSITVSYSDVNGTGVYSGTGNINRNPLFVDVNNPAGVDGIFFTDDDGLQIASNSDCVDTGTDSDAPEEDILGQTRVDIPYVGVTGRTFDMGAYEVPRPVWYVQQDGADTNGIGWNNAFKYLQDALTAARTYGGEIWVAKGTYKPDEDHANPTGTGNRDANFALINGVGIYGGFDCNETMHIQHNPILNETILSGAISESPDSNSYHVVTSNSDINNTAVLDGFTIRGGKANGTPSPKNCGSGIYNDGSPAVTNCIFKENNASSSGGAVYNNHNNAVFANCIVSENNATSGGGTYNDNSNSYFTDCVFYKNTATGESSDGGGMRNTQSNPTLMSCLFRENSAYNGAGMSSTSSSSPILINCTFNKNSATASDGGGGMYNYESSTKPNVTNCVFWGDLANNSGNEVFNGNGADPCFAYCDIQGCGYSINWNASIGTNNGGNIDDEPCFMDQDNPVGADGIWRTMDDGLQFVPESNDAPCIDAADGNAVPSSDICGNLRFDTEFVPNIGSGNPDYADIGAYEYYNPEGYTTSFEVNQGYPPPSTSSSNINGVDGWKVEEKYGNSGKINYTTYDGYSYQYIDVYQNSIISYDTGGACEKSIIRINCIPSPGSYINIMNGDANIAAIKFGKAGDFSTYVLDNGVYKTADTTPDYNTVATKCRNFISSNPDTGDPCYSYENSWIEFTIQFDWARHTYDVNWINYANQSGTRIYTGAKLHPYYQYYTKIKFSTNVAAVMADANIFELNRMSLSDIAQGETGGVIGSGEDIWVIAPSASISSPLKGRCPIAGQMWYDKLGNYIIKCCPTDLDPNDPCSWMEVCSGKSAGKYPIILGYWNIDRFYNGDYFLKIEVYDDIGRLYADANITTERTFNGRTRECMARYPIIGRFKPRTFNYEGPLPDFKINWPGTFPFEFRRTYNSGMSSRLYPLFFGWTHNHNIHLIEDCSFDSIMNNGTPVSDGSGLGIGRLWLNLPSGGGLFIGHVDGGNPYMVVYEPVDKLNHYITRITSVDTTDHDNPVFDVNYVYHSPDGMRMTFHKVFTVHYPIPANGEGLIDWMVYKGIDRQEDRFGNALVYEWDAGNEICLQKISNNRTPANLRFTYGLLGSSYLCDEVRIYDSDTSTTEHVSFAGSSISPNTAYYEAWRWDQMADLLGMVAKCSYSHAGQGFMLKDIMVPTSADTANVCIHTTITAEYDANGALAKRKAVIDGVFPPLTPAPNPYQPSEYYNYEYDNMCNLTTTIEVNSADSSSRTPLRKEIFVTSPDGALLEKSTITGTANFDPYDYHSWGNGNLPKSCNYHAGGGGTIDTEYYYGDSRFPLKPTIIAEYLDDDGDGVYDRSGKKTAVTYDSNGNVITQKVYVDDVNYAYTTFCYHQNYDFPTRKTTWQGYCHDEGEEVNTSGARVEKQWLYGDANGNLIADGNAGEYLVHERVLLDDAEEEEEWADTNYAYYSGGQVKQKTDPEGSITYCDYDVNGFEVNEWQGATIVDGYPVGNPQKRYYYDGRGRKILEGDYLGKVTMNLYATYDPYGTEVKEIRQYIDPNTPMSLSRQFEPNYYDADIPHDSSADWWLNRTLYGSYYASLDKPVSVTLPTGGGSSFEYTFGENGVHLLNYSLSAALESIHYSMAVDDGRPFEENRDYGDSRDRLVIAYVYDSMKRLLHKYSHYDFSINGDQYNRYIKHEEYQYDAVGNKTSEKVYKVKMRLTSAPDWVRLEKRNSYEYDILGRLTKEVVDSNAANGLNLTTQYGYDALGNRIWVIDPCNNVIFTDYDNANRKICEYFAVPPVYMPGSTSDINFIATKDTATVRKDVYYYKNDKIKDVNSYDYAYITNGLLAGSHYDYDSRGRINAVTEKVNPWETDAITSYDYDDSGFTRDGDPCKYQIKITDGEGKNTWISMHPLGKPQKIVYPSGDYEEYIYYKKPLGFYTHEYIVYYTDPCTYFNGLLEKKAVWDANGVKEYITYEYDDYGKVSKITYPDNGYLIYDYNTMRIMGDNGRPKQIIGHRVDADRPGSDVNSYGIYTFNYWALTGKVRSYTDYNGFTVNYDYSAAYGQLTDLDVNDPCTVPIYDVNYVYDMAGRLIDVCEPMLGTNNLIAGFNYDRNGNRSQLNYYRQGTRGGDATSMDYIYNPDNMLTYFATSGGPTFSFDAYIDGLGRFSEGTEAVTNTSNQAIYYGTYFYYDMRSQLTYAYNGLYDLEMAYDKAGNMTDYYNNGWHSIYTSPGDLTEVDAAGRRIWWNDNGAVRAIGYDTNFVYNRDGKLRHAEAQYNTIDLKYDPMGNRVYKASSTQGTRKYIVDISGGLPTILLEVNSASGSIMKSYVYANGEILVQHDGDVNAARYFYLHDRLGSVRDIIGTDGLVKNYYTYDPFGQLTAENAETIENPFKFTGQYFDSEIGQYYLRARMYDPILGRFTGRDPERGRRKEPLTLHKYLYCLNDPINKQDPSGLFFRELLEWVEGVLGFVASDTGTIAGGGKATLEGGTAVMSYSVAINALSEDFDFIGTNKYTKLKNIATGPEEE